MATATKAVEAETLFLRIDPRLKKLITERVDELNKGRPLGTPELTLNTFAATILAGAFAGEQPTKPKPKLVAPARKAVRK